MAHSNIKWCKNRLTCICMKQKSKRFVVVFETVDLLNSVAFFNINWITVLASNISFSYINTVR